MPDFLSLVLESFWSASTKLFIGMVACVALYILYKIIKSRLSKKSKTNDERGLSIPNEQHWAELQDIKKKMDAGGPIKIDAVKALYIAQHWDEYNLVASEDGKILYDRLKQASDIVDVEDKPKTISNSDNGIWVERLENGITRRHTNLGYVDFQDGLIVNSKSYDDVANKQKKPVKQVGNQSKQEKQAQIQNVRDNFEDDDEETGVTKNENQETNKEIPSQKKSETNTRTEQENKNSLEYFAEQQKLKMQRDTQSQKNITEEKTEKGLDENISPASTEKNIAPSPTPQKKVQENISSTLNPKAAQEKFSSEEKIIDAKALANLISKPQKVSQKKEVLEFDPTYTFENTKLFFSQDFLCERGDFKTKFTRFISFLALHDFVFLAEGDKRMFAHVDSFVMALARTIQPQYRLIFLNTLYNKDGALDNYAFCVMMQMFATKLDLYFDKGLFFSSNLQGGGKAFMFSRGLKRAGKIILGEFVVLTLSNAMELLSDVDTSGLTDTIVLATKASEFEAIKGKRLKIKTLEEIQDVL